MSTTLVTRISLVTPPALEPISIDRARNHLRISGMDEDEDISGYLASARGWVEGHTGRALYKQQWKGVLDAFPESGGAIQLPRPPFMSIVSFRYYDVDGVLQTLTADDYFLDGTFRAVLAPSTGAWPDTQERPGAVLIQWWAGYTNGGSPAVEGDPSGLIPTPMKQAILLMLGHFYENREPEVVGTQVSQFQMGAERLLSNLREEGF